MKKFIFVMPLMAVSLLSSCGGGSKDPVMHTLKFEGTHCEMHDESGKTVITKQFEAGQTASFHLVGETEEFEIPKETNVKLIITGTDDPFDGTFTYNQTDGSLSVKMTADITVTATSDVFDPYKVTEQEFKDACSFKDVEYLQVTNNLDEGPESSQTIYELSPTVSYKTFNNDSGSLQEDCTRKKDDGTYDMFSRFSKDSKYTYIENASEEFFITPQSDKINLLTQFAEGGLSFASFTYNENEGIYTSSFVQDLMQINFSVKFLLKKVISFTATCDDPIHYQNITYKYEEKTPSLPTMDKWYEYEDWWKYCSLDASCRATPEDLYREVDLTVNGITQKVRLIDMDKDVDENGNKIHCTFEFVNLLSDENGYSIATYWNDTNVCMGASCYYRESTIRKALNGNSGDINWFRFYGFLQGGEEDTRNRKFATEDNYKMSVLDMLNAENEGIGNFLKAPSKYINIWNDKKLPEAGWEEQTVNDKIFLLSPAEMGRVGHQEEEQLTTPYAYYCTEDADIIKKQINGNDGARNFPLVGDDLDGKYEEIKQSFAGHNSNNEAFGSNFWLRSPYVNYHPTQRGYCAYGGVCEGEGFPPFTAYRDALPVAPAFCI